MTVEAGLFDLRNLVVDLVQRLPNRLHQRLNRLLPLFQIAGGLLLQLRERLLRLLQEIAPIGSQCVGRQSFELVGEPLMCRPLRLELSG